MNIWTDCEKVALPSLLSFIVDNRGKTVPTSETGHILIATNCIKNDHLFPVYEKVRFLSQETYDTFFRAHPIPGDIIFVNKGTPGRCALVPDPVDFCIAQDMMAFRVDSSKVNNMYLLAVLRSYEVQRLIYSISVGDVIPHFKKQMLDKILIPLPPLEIQNKIASYFSDFNYKIETNRRICENLEAQAQALFKNWFIDFEPFKDGEFVETELGRIPKGWEVGMLKEICVTNKRSIGRKVPSVIHYLDTGSITNNIIEQIQTLHNSTDEIPSRAKRLVQEGDIIFSTVRPNQKHYGFLLSPSLDLVVSTGFCVITANWSGYRHYIYQFLTQDKTVNLLQSIAEQSVSTYPSINASDIESLQIVIPPMSEMSKFAELLNKMYQMRDCKYKENQRLSALRDALLPKLMSGEVAV